MRKNGMDNSLHEGGRQRRAANNREEKDFPLLSVRLPTRNYCLDLLQRPPIALRNRLHRVCDRTPTKAGVALSRRSVSSVIVVGVLEECSGGPLDKQAGEVLTVTKKEKSPKERDEDCYPMLRMRSWESDSISISLIIG
jgi:hypothetical protein